MKAVPINGVNLFRPGACSPSRSPIQTTMTRAPQLRERAPCTRSTISRASHKASLVFPISSLSCLCKVYEWHTSLYSSMHTVFIVHLEYVQTTEYRALQTCIGRYINEPLGDDASVEEDSRMLAFFDHLLEQEFETHGIAEVEESFDRFRSFPPRLSSSSSSSPSLTTEFDTDIEDDSTPSAPTSPVPAYEYIAHPVSAFSYSESRLGPFAMSSDSEHSFALSADQFPTDLQQSALAAGRNSLGRWRPEGPPSTLVLAQSPERLPTLSPRPRGRRVLSLEGRVRTRLFRRSHAFVIESSSDDSDSNDAQLPHQSNEVTGSAPLVPSDSSEAAAAGDSDSSSILVRKKRPHIVAEYESLSEVSHSDSESSPQHWSRKRVRFDSEASELARSAAGGSPAGCTSTALLARNNPDASASEASATVLPVSASANARETDSAASASFTGLEAPRSVTDGDEPSSATLTRRGLLETFMELNSQVHEQDTALSPAHPSAQSHTVNSVHSREISPIHQIMSEEHTPTSEGGPFARPEGSSPFFPAFHSVISFDDRAGHISVVHEAPHISPSQGGSTHSSQQQSSHNDDDPDSPETFSSSGRPAATDLQNERHSIDELIDRCKHRLHYERIARLTADAVFRSCSPTSCSTSPETALRNKPEMSAVSTLRLLAAEKFANSLSYSDVSRTPSARQPQARRSVFL